MKVAVKITGAAETRKALQRIANAPRRALDATAEDVESYVEDQAGKHSKSGKLFASVTKRRTQSGWFVGHNVQVAPHARWVHWGTGLFGPRGQKYEIKPKNKKALRWPSGGKFIFARGVKHPGIKGDPWMTRATANAPSIFARHVEAILRKG